MTIRGLIAALTQQEDLNFLLTNRIPRAALTRFMGWFAKIENPLVRDASIACWRLFSDLDLSEAKKTEFKSLHDCFTRELRPGLRPADPDPAVVASPSDGIIGAFGRIEDTKLLQTRLASGEALTLVPVAAILVASIRLHFLDVTLNAQSKGPVVFPCDAEVRKGDELGWFEHGSTIIVLTPDHFEFCDNVMEGACIRAGEPLLRKPSA